MIIAQLSDLHIGFSGRGQPCLNLKRLNQVLASINQLRRQPDLMIISGDLIDPGTQWAYRDLQRALTNLNIPVFLALGNHDRRAAFIKVFGDYRLKDGYLQYTIEDWPLRIIVLDTLDEGQHGGSFCKTRADWLESTLNEQPRRPTLLVLHHPPTPSGIDWLTARREDGWVRRLTDVVRAAPNVKHIMAGHIHRSFFTQFAGVGLSVCPAVAPQLYLEFDRIDPDKADGRPLLVEDGPGYCLHKWDGEELISHVNTAPHGKVLLKYTPEYQKLIKHTQNVH